MTKDNKDIKTGVIENSTQTTGNVKITIIKGGKPVRIIDTHNTGTKALCSYIVNALLGKYDVSNMPGKLYPCKAILEGSSIKLQPLFSYGIPFSKCEKGDTLTSDSYDMAKFSFLIPNTILSVGLEIGGFILAPLSDTSGKEVYASLQLPEKLIITSDSSLNIEWALKVSPSQIIPTEQGGN